MLLKLLAFAEYAAVTQENKLIVAGIVDQVEVRRRPGAPAQPDGAIVALPLPPLYLVAILEASISEGTVHQAALRLLDQDHQPLADPVQLGQWTFIVNPFGRPMRFQAVVHLGGVAVPPGTSDYEFQLLIDGEPIGEPAMLYVQDHTASA
jgi:hypothetical protein